MIRALLLFCLVACSSSPDDEVVDQEVETPEVCSDVAGAYDVELSAASSSDCGSYVPDSCTVRAEPLEELSGCLVILDCGPSVLQTDAQPAQTFEDLAQWPVSGVDCSFSTLRIGEGFEFVCDFGGRVCEGELVR